MDKQELLGIIASCWRKGYRFNKIKEELRHKGYVFEVTEHDVSNWMHEIMDSGGLKNY